MVIDYPDIYYSKIWGQLNESKDKGKWDCFLFESNLGKVYYPFIKRRIDIKVNNKIYYDIVTPYGFNGPVIIENFCDDIDKLVEEFNNEFNKFCNENNIVSEYIRFSPWLKNHKYLSNIYNIKNNNVTLYVDLKKDFFYEEFSSKCRNVIRKAIKNNVKVKFDFYGDTIEEFYRLYNEMAYKNNVSEFYKFDIDFLKALFNGMKGNIFIANAIYKGKYISSAMFLYNKDYIHYHLSGNDYNHTTLGGNSLILYEVAKFAKKKEIKEFHLGGANGEALLKFKKQFTKGGVLDFFVGTKIRNEDIYYKLVEINGRNKGYFPEYR